MWHRRVWRAARVRATYSSRNTDWESATPIHSKPRSSASAHSSPKRASDSGRKTIPKRASVMTVHRSTP